MPLLQQCAINKIFVSLLQNSGVSIIYFIHPLINMKVDKCKIIVIKCANSRIKKLNSLNSVLKYRIVEILGQIYGEERKNIEINK